MHDLARLDLTEAEFAKIRQLVFEFTGISLSNSKKELVKRRFKPRLKELGINSFTSYIKLLKNNHEREIANFCNAITTNLTSFFRENHHFEFLRNEAIPSILNRNGSQGKKIRVWSAGCSTGQEAYCLAMILRSSISAINRWDVKILASDLDEKCLNVARNGIYAKEGIEKVSDKDLIFKYFTETEQIVDYKNTVLLQAKSELKQMITFNRLNLMNTTWPMKKKFDVIFCRNVFIYFDKATQLDLVKRYAALQTPGSYLCLGHSETISDPKDSGYKLVGKTIYIRE